MVVSGTVTTLPLTVTLPVHTPALPTHPVPEVTCACGLPVTVTLPEKVTTMVKSCVPPWVRHSTPSVPVSGSATSNVPAAPWVIRGTAFVTLPDAHWNL